MFFAARRKVVVIEIRVFFGSWRVKIVKSYFTEKIFRFDINWVLKFIKGSYVDVEEDRVVVGITVRWVDVFKFLRELDIINAVFFTVYYKVYIFSDSLGVVDVMVIVKIKDEGFIRYDCGGTN